MSPFLFADAILHDRPVKVFNQGDMLRDFTYIDDIAEGVIRCIDRVAEPDPAWNAECPDPACSSAPYRIYNIGNSEPVRLMDFIAAVEAACEKEAVKEYLPMQPGDVYQTNADTSALQRDMGINLRKTSGKASGRPWPGLSRIIIWSSCFIFDLNSFVYIPVFPYCFSGKGFFI